jgi:PhzF family phenazine biosynthesis protein
MGTLLLQVDAFTNTPFTGNPAAVVLLPQPRDDTWMQHVAREMNLSETAFLIKWDDHFVMRWFTPAVEVDLCGHATLASAHILWESGLLASHEQARFQTRSGLLTAERKGEWIELNFPASPVEETTPPPELEEALGVPLLFTGKSVFDYLVEVENEEIVRNLNPDSALLKTLPVRGVIVTSKATSSGYDFVSRFFAPAVGVEEDPVTGSAHCCLGPYWQGVMGKQDFTAYQASPRGGVIGVSVEDEGERVYLRGQAVTVLRGELVD